MDCRVHLKFPPHHHGTLSGEGSVYGPFYSDPAVVSNSPTIPLVARLYLTSHLTSLFCPIDFLKEPSTVLSPDTSSLYPLASLPATSTSAHSRRGQTIRWMTDCITHSLLPFLIMPEALQHGRSLPCASEDQAWYLTVRGGQITSSASSTAGHYGV